MGPFMCCLELLDVYRAVVDRRLTGDGRIDARAAGADALDRQQVGTIAQLQAGGDQNIAVAGGELWGSNVSIRCKQERINGCVVSQVRLPVGVDPDDEERLPVAWKLTEEPSTVVVITAVPVPTLLIWKMYPSLTLLPNVTETAEGLEDVAAGCVVLFVNTL